MKFINLTGQRFTKLIAIKPMGKNKSGNYLWLCKCDCGKEKIVMGNNLRKRKTQSCGCIRNEQLIQINQTKKNRWTKIEIDTLKEFYPNKGGVWCSNKLKKSSEQIKNKARRLNLKTKYKQGKLPVETMYRLDDTNVMALCPVHGKCQHISIMYGTQKRRSPTCRLCKNFYTRIRNKTEKGKEKRREINRKRLKDPINRFASNIRSRLRQGLNRISIKDNKYKIGTFRFLPYSPLDLFDHLENIKKLQNNKCPYCKISYGECKMSIDHMVPLIKAKTEQEIIDLFNLENLSLLCKNCNSSKNDNNLQEWGKSKNIFNNCVLSGGTVIG